MTLVLELSPEAENRLQAVAAARGQEISQFLLETANRSIYPMEAASQELHLTSSSLQERAERGELETVTVEGELFFVRDARFDALQQLQAERIAGLQEIVRLSEEMGLYDHQK